LYNRIAAFRAERAQISTKSARLGLTLEVLLAPTAHITGARAGLSAGLPDGASANFRPREFYFMPQTVQLAFDDLKATPAPVLVILVEPERKLSPTAKKLDKAAGGAIIRALEAVDFKGKHKSACDIPGIDGGDFKRVIAIGVGKADELEDRDRTMLGGYIAGQLSGKGIRAACVLGETAGVDGQAKSAALSARLAMGIQLRCYAFDKHKSQPKNDENRAGVLETVTILTATPDAAIEAHAPLDAVAEGTALARDLVNEPANHLGPSEFAAVCESLSEVGVEVEIFDEKQLADMNMHALLAVAQGSARPGRVAIMHWNGASKRTKPVCFIGKGVVFDTGGISIKPSAGMEDMKGDMGGAACVVGLMHALAKRKAAVNAVGLVGLVENMPSDRAMRPGDVIGSRKGKTIEVLNTDAEGRLVLADLLAYAEETYAPKFMVNLATLTGAIIIALGKEYAGMFSNNTRLADELSKAGEATGERVWRMPLDKGYDKLLDSKTADMKNIGGRNGGSITAAQFLQRFVDDTPWAHLDIAGVAFASPKSEINPSWGSGWGVMLLNELVADAYEK
jgi:leucyl aminopeptidase